MDNPSIDDKCRIVYEKLTGKCAHGNGQWDKVDGSSFIEGMIYRCKRCGETYPTSISGPSLPGCPPLATSLNEWAKHIWPVIHKWEGQKLQVWLDALEVAVLGHTIDIATAQDVESVVTASAMHHLEATYNVVKGE